MAGRQYITSQGDMWDAMAKELLGSELLMGKLVEANPAHAATVFFSAGVVLNVPEVDSQEIRYPQPPWKVAQ